MNLHMMTKKSKKQEVREFWSKIRANNLGWVEFWIWFECESCRNLQDEWKDGKMIEWCEKIRENKRGKDKTRQDRQDKTDKTRQDKTRQDKTRQREE